MHEKRKYTYFAVEGLTSTSKILKCETSVNINSEQLAYPPSTCTVSTQNAVNKNSQEYTDSTHSFPLLAPVVTF